MSSETLVLTAEKRTDVGRSSIEALRNSGKVPAVVYGHGVESLSLTVDAVAMQRVFEQAGESTIISLDIAGDTRSVLIHDLQRHAVGNQISHVDFYQVNMNEETTAEVEIVFEGIAPAEKALGGILIKSIDHVAVTCLPKDLPHHISVNLESLATFDDVIRVSDLQVPAGVTIDHAADDVVVSVSQPRSEAELEALNTEVVENVENVEVTTAKEGEAAAEGAATEEKK